jgi:hypothetical protein
MIPKPLSRLGSTSLAAALLGLGQATVGLAQEAAPAAPKTAPAGSAATPAAPPPAPAPAKPVVDDTKAIVSDAAAKPSAAAAALADGAPPVNDLPALLPPPQEEGLPTTSVTINLLQILVKKGILTHGEAQGMIEQAQVEAAQAQAAMEEAKFMAPQDGDVRVTYVPDVVKNEIKDAIKADVMAQARADGWTAPNEAPEWTQRVKLFGDVRLRFESSIFPDGNDNTGAFPNFNAINTGAPFDVAGTVFSPQHNVDEDRNRFKLRARLGADIDLDEHWFAGIRIATGQDNSPVTQNQGLGVANGAQGGNFSKYSLWLDRGFIRYQNSFTAEDDFSLTFGRFDNPFFSTSLIWADEMGFDGIAISGKKKVTDHFTLFSSAGVFPVFNTDFNFSSNQPSKFDSTDKYLYGGQLGVVFRPVDKIEAKFAAAIYKFDGVEGELSDPYIPLTAQDAGNTDNTRPSFAQRGNTYRALRDIIPGAINGFGTTNQYQYFGLASPFEELAFTGKIDFNHWEPYQLSLIGEYVENLSFDKDAINQFAVNNRGTDPVLGQVGDYAGDGTGWLVKLQFGKPTFEKAGDWSAWIDYRRVGSDSVVDAFNDDDLGDGGTNMEGYTVGGHVALSKRVRLGARWLSATQLAGPPLKMDIFMIDISAKF